MIKDSKGCSKGVAELNSHLEICLGQNPLPNSLRLLRHFTILGNSLLIPLSPGIPSLLLSWVAAPDTCWEGLPQANPSSKCPIQCVLLPPGGHLFFKPLFSSLGPSRESHSVQFSSVAQSCPKTLCNPMDCSTPGFPVHHQLLKLTQTHVHRVGDAIQPSHPLSSPFPPAFNLSQHQGLLQWVSFLHQMAKVLELHHQSLQRLFKVDFL